MQFARIVIVVVATALFVSWAFAAARRPPQVDQATGATVLRYSLPLRVLGFVTGLGMPVLVIVLVFFVPFRTHRDVIAAGGLFLFFGLLGGVLLLETVKVRIAFSDQQIVSDSPWRGRRTVRWGDVSAVSYSPSSSWFVIKDKQGQTIRASQFLVGIRTLADANRQHVPPEHRSQAQAGFDQIDSWNGSRQPSPP